MTINELKAKNEKRFGWVEVQPMQFSIYQHEQYSEVRYDAQASNGHWYTAERVPAAVPRGAIVKAVRPQYVAVRLDGLVILFSSLTQAKRAATRYGVRLEGWKKAGRVWQIVEEEAPTDFAMM